MPRLTTLNKMLLPALLTAGMSALAGVQASGVSAQAASRLWSIGIHFEYQDGTDYDIVLQRGVPTEEMPGVLAECGQSHWTGSVVRYHCYPIPE